MKLLQSILERFTLLSFLFFSHTNLFAGSSTTIGTINYSIPGAGVANIPTLSNYMLIILSLLLFVVALRITRKKNSSINKLFVTLIGVSALLAGIGGVKIISEVRAGMTLPEAVSLTLNNETTGTETIFGPDTNYYHNQFSVPITITSIVYDSDLYFCNNIELESELTAAKPIDIAAPICKDVSPDNIIAPDAQCQLSCYSLSMEISDRRLKKDITPLKQLENNIQLYSFKYKWSDKTQVGVMAQDLLKDDRFKHAVSKMSTDFYGVNYHQLGLKMISLEQWQKSPDDVFVTR